MTSKKWFSTAEIRHTQTSSIDLFEDERWLSSQAAAELADLLKEDDALAEDDDKTWDENFQNMKRRIDIYIIVQRVLRGEE